MRRRLEVLQPFIAPLALLLNPFCSDKVTIGFITLRGLVLQRPSLRTEALHVLLELTTHPGKCGSCYYIAHVNLYDFR